MNDWPDSQLRQDFMRLVAQDGAKNVAPQIPADRATVYRLVSGETVRPSRALRAGIARFVAERTSPNDSREA